MKNTHVHCTFTFYMAMVCKMEIKMHSNLELPFFMIGGGCTPNWAKELFKSLNDINNRWL